VSTWYGNNPFREQVDFFAPRDVNVYAIPVRYADRLRFIKSAEDLHFVDTMLADALASDFPFVAMDTEGNSPCRLLQCATKQWSIIIDLKKLAGCPQLASALKRIFAPGNGLSKLGKKVFAHTAFIATFQDMLSTATRASSPTQSWVATR
jgi:hypothetical protein